MKVLTLIFFVMIFGKLFGQKMQEVDNSYVFDKAKYHFETISNAGLDEDQAYVHTGLFFAWLIDRDLVSTFFKEESNDEIEQFKNREITPCKIYMNWDGALVGDLLNKEGYNFALHYFEFGEGDFLNDYDRILCSDHSDMFRVKDSWDNYDKLKLAIDEAYKKWKK